MRHSLILSGQFRWEIVDQFGVPIERGVIANGIVDDAIDDLLDSHFSNGTPEAAWYLGLIDTTNFSALSSSDSMGSHAGWQELTGYSEATRPAWGPGNSASGVKTNAAAVVFTASSDINVKGLFVASNNTKGGSTGTLWSTATFGTEKNLAPGRALKAFYEARGRQG